MAVPARRSPGSGGIPGCPGSGHRGLSDRRRQQSDRPRRRHSRGG